MKTLRYYLLIILLIVGNNHSFAQVKKKMNVLFIAVDDLKPILGCYGDKMIKTPNIDRIAKNGTVFLSNYCQQAVCGPTRASIMTGKRPDYTKVWDLKTKMRAVNLDIVSIPQYFSSQGYSSQGIGKVYDPRCVDDEIDKPSWTVPYYKTDKKYYSSLTGPPANGQYQNPITKKLIEESKGNAVVDGNNIGAKTTNTKPSIESENLPDNAYTDGANALQAKDILINLSKNEEPFFFALGFVKPHLPFVAPTKYWDLYDRNRMPLAPYQQKSKNGLDLAYHNASELQAYSDIPSLTSFTDQQEGLTLSVEKQKELIHGYYAAVSYTDAQIGKVLNTLDSLGLTDNTIIVLWGDHGWHLGDHNLWCKHTNFEQATHAPLIISAPNIAPSKVTSPTEFIDIFPTLCELANLTIPNYLDGTSLVKLMKNPSAEGKKFAVSQYPRDQNSRESGRLGYSEGKYMGYSIRNNRYRYTVWMKDNFRSYKAFNENLLIGAELYDYKKDPNETVNVAAEKQYTATRKKLHQNMLRFFAAEYQKSNQK
jgi:arylsulfatase A-like enzyme